MPYGPHARSISADEYEFHCSAPDCTEHAHNAEDFLKCDGCNALICMEHSHHPQDMPYLRFCEACFRCVQCGELAFAMCEECGDLRCRAHTLGGSERVDDWNLGDITYFCAGECMGLHAKSVQSKSAQSELGQNLTEKREAV